MSPEEKQALIEHAKSWIADAEAARDDIPFGFDEDTEMELSLIKIALAALTAQPIELPQRYSCEGYHIDEAYLVEDEDGDCFDRDEVIEKLRQQGYEVQE